MIGHLTLHQGNNLINDVIDVERRLLNVGPFCQRADTLDDLACAIAVIDNPLDRAARGVQVGGSAVEPAQTGFARWS